jgi:hypothetical protein
MHGSPAYDGVLRQCILHRLLAVGFVQGCAVAIAMSLGLRSIASVDGFVNADTGELIVRDVKPTPALTDGSPLLQQVGQDTGWDVFWSF